MDILTCPFCGCKPKMIKDDSSLSPMSVGSFEVTIGCYSKNCKVHPSLTGYSRFAYSKEEKNNVINEVIRTWNTRKK